MAYVITLSKNTEMGHTISIAYDMAIKEDIDLT